jgi:CRP-like cAMP-binding protein
MFTTYDYKVRPVDFFWQYLKMFISLSPQLKVEIERNMTPLSIRKGEILHKTGSYCRRYYFVKQGLIRAYYILEDKEVTNSFATENDWITSVNSFYKDEPSDFTLQALEDSELWYFTKTDLEILYEKFPEMNQFGRMLMTRNYVEQTERLTALNFVPAHQRYSDFIKKNPNLMNRIPLGMLASYLGITQETLSRVRRSPHTF